MDIYEILNLIVKFPFYFSNSNILKTKLFIASCLLTLISWSVYGSNEGISTEKSAPTKTEVEGDEKSSPKVEESTGESSAPNASLRSLPVDSVQEQSLSKFNYIFYFIYKYKYENKLGEFDQLTTE